MCLKDKLKAGEQVIGQILTGEKAMLDVRSTNGGNCSRLGKETKRLPGVH